MSVGMTYEEWIKVLVARFIECNDPITPQNIAIMSAPYRMSVEMATTCLTELGYADRGVDVYDHSLRRVRVWTLEEEGKDNGPKITA